MRINTRYINFTKGTLLSEWRLMVLLALEKSKVRSDKSYHPGFPCSLVQNFSFIFSIAANCMIALTPTVTHARIVTARHQTVWEWDPSFCHDQYTDLLNGFPFRTAFSTLFIDWLMTICKWQGGTLEPIMWYEQNTSTVICHNMEIPSVLLMICHNMEIPPVLLMICHNMEIPSVLLMICHQKKDPSVTYYGSAFKRKIN